MSADTMTQFKERVEKINAAVPNLNLVVTDNEGDYKGKRDRLGGNVNDYYERELEAKRIDGEEAVPKLEAAYDILCDPYSSDKYKNKVWEIWDNYDKLEPEYGILEAGKAGLSYEIIKEYRDKIVSLGYPPDINDAMVYMIKSESTPEAAKQRFDYIMSHSSSTNQKHEVIKLYRDHTPANKRYREENEEADKVEAARKAADATGQGPTWD
jgi:hypothetical protein